MLAIDPSRADDPEIAAEGERERLVALAARFSREDLMRAFDVIARAEFEIRGATQPRYHLEMALLRWMHLRKLVPLTELLEGTGTPSPSGPARGGGRPAQQSAAPSRAATRRAPAKGSASPSAAPGGRASAVTAGHGPSSPPRSTAALPAAQAPAPATADDTEAKAALMAEIKRTKKFFYGTVVAQAQRIDLAGDRLVFTFTPAQRTLAGQLEQNRAWLEATSAQMIGRKVTVSAHGEVESSPESSPMRLTDSPVAGPPPEPKSETESADGLRARAMSDSVVKAMLDVFPAEIEDVEKI